VFVDGNKMITTYYNTAVRLVSSVITHCYPVYETLRY